ncbi:hypothetical protein IBTHAUMO2_330013 [Nitrosopumilaceae archaeon]|nr:hypothetical protein [Nitrosopumilus sp.]CAI9831635.1 hypothetical protein IBTHAUMO2_330013 [Nitrosopumilaceae archaeon]MDA7945337.1 hypothetical protein [Nitrosopumilus sp.]MDA7955313.1 hypothetical protein [Nitrosopumilus sp.]MDA7974277.1 hypothetical protein [Nitrosopumilus sp.]
MASGRGDGQAARGAGRPLVIPDTNVWVRYYRCDKKRILGADTRKIIDDAIRSGRIRIGRIIYGEFFRYVGRGIQNEVLEGGSDWSPSNEGRITKLGESADRFNAMYKRHSVDYRDVMKRWPEMLARVEKMHREIMSSTSSGDMSARRRCAKRKISPAIRERWDGLGAEKQDRYAREKVMDQSDRGILATVASLSDLEGGGIVFLTDDNDFLSFRKRIAGELGVEIQKAEWSGPRRAEPTVEEQLRTLTKQWQRDRKAERSKGRRGRRGAPWI